VLRFVGLGPFSPAWRMTDVGSAIKDLFKDELDSLRELQTKQDERIVQLEKACQEVPGLVEERDRDAQNLRSNTTLREDLDKQKGDHEALDARVKEFETFDVATLRDRIVRLEDDTDGIGGVKQLWERLEASTKEIRDWQPRIDDCSRIVSATKTRTDELELQVKQFGRQFGEVQETLRSSEEKWVKIEEASASTTLAQQALEDSVARKYEALWEDVLHALEEFKGKQVEELRQELEQRRDGGRTDTKNMVSYALNVLGSAHAERRQSAFSKSLVAAWREQAWNSARRRMGLWRLHCITQRRHREALCRWVRQTSVEQLSIRLREEMRALIPNVPLVVQEMGLPSRCTEMEEALSGLSSSKCSMDQFQKDQEQQEDRLQKAIESVNYRTTIETLQVSLKEVQPIIQDAVDRSQEVATRLAQQERVSTDLGQDLQTRAEAKEVQTMMKDVLLMWNSIKQLDTAKADKKELDAYAVENGSKDRLSSRRLEDLESDVGSRVREEVLKTQERWTDLEGRVEENAKQFRHWEKMWEKLATFVEDLVGKIAELQGAAAEGSTMRPPSANSRATTREAHDVNRAGRATPPKPQCWHGKSALNRSSTDGLALGPVLNGGSDATADASKMLWMNSAQGIVDATLDQALGVGQTTRAHASKLGRPVRPSSASSTRKGHDRGRTSAYGL